MSSTSSGNVTPKASAKPKFSTHLKDLLEAAKSVLAHQKDLQTLDQLINEKRDWEQKFKTMTAKLTATETEIESIRKAKDQEITELKKEKKILIKEFKEESIADGNSKNRQKELESQVTILKQELSNRVRAAKSSESEVADLRDELEMSREELKTKEDCLKSMNERQFTMGLELKGARSKLEELQQDQQALGFANLNEEDL